MDREQFLKNYLVPDRRGTYCSKWDGLEEKFGTGDIIPSATSKAAILVPIMKPVADALGLQPNLAVVAYQMGDSFTNLISPLLGWMIGSCAMANVPYATWLKWVLPKVLIFIVLACLIVLLTVTGWTGVI